MHVTSAHAVIGDAEDLVSLVCLIRTSHLTLLSPKIQSSMEIWWESSSGQQLLLHQLGFQVRHWKGTRSLTHPLLSSSPSNTGQLLPWQGSTYKMYCIVLYARFLSLENHPDSEPEFSSFLSCRFLSV